MRLTTQLKTFPNSAHDDFVDALYRPRRGPARWVYWSVVAIFAAFAVGYVLGVSTAQPMAEAIWKVIQLVEGDAG